MSCSLQTSMATSLSFALQQQQQSTLPMQTVGALRGIRWFSGYLWRSKVFAYAGCIFRPAGLFVFFFFTLENSASSHKMEDDDLLPRDVECSWWLPLEPSLARAVLPGRVRSRCLAGSAVLHRCRRPGQALCWCTDTLPGAGPAATLGSQAGGLLRQHCWYPLDGAESGGARAWDTHRCDYQHTCHILQGKVRKTLSAWCCHEDPCHQQDHVDPSACPTISQQHSSHTHHAHLHVA